MVMELGRWSMLMAVEMAVFSRSKDGRTWIVMLASQPLSPDFLT